MVFNKSELAIYRDLDGWINDIANIMTAVDSTKTPCFFSSVTFYGIHLPDFCVTTPTFWAFQWLHARSNYPLHAHTTIYNQNPTGKWKSLTLGGSVTLSLLLMVCMPMNM